MRTAAFHNLGCKVNAYETEAMQQLLEEAGYEIVPFDEKADVYIINTCSVTNIADRKSRQMLHRAKKQNPDAVVVAAGCYVQAAAEELKEDAAVDLIIGNNRKAGSGSDFGRLVCRRKEMKESSDRTSRDPMSTRSFTLKSRRNTPVRSSRSRTDATSSAAIASSRTREAASEAAGRRTWRRK